MPCYDALIIGGGPSGSTIGLLLANAGYSVAIIEKKIFPRRKVCGEFISATTLSLLSKLGLDDYFCAYAGPEVKRVGLYAGETILSSSMPKYLTENKVWGRALAREYLDTLLLEKARQAGATIWQPWDARKLIQNDNVFICQLTTHNECIEISAPIVILASGSWERNIVTPKTAKHKASDLLAFKAHFNDSQLSLGIMPLLAFPGGYGGMVQVDDRRISLSCCIRRDQLQNIRRPGINAGNAVLKHISDTTRGVREVLDHTKLDGAWLSVGPIQPGVRTPYANGIFYVGNIVGEAHPIIAEGISMAIQSAWMLAEILTKQSTLKQAGEEYNLKWRTQFANRIRAAALFAQIASRPYAIQTLVPILKLFPKILTFGARLSGKTFAMGT